MAHSSSELLAFWSLGVGVSAVVSIPVLLWADADYLLVADWRALGDRLLVESRRAVDGVRVLAREAALSTAAALLLLTTPTTEVSS